MKFMNVVNKFTAKMKNKKMAVSSMALVALMTVAGSASAAAPNTGNTSIDAILTEMLGGFTTAEKAFIVLAIAAIPVTLIVVLFFWLRGKFKQSVSGA